MNLLIDIGNTTIKVAEASQFNSLRNYRRINYEKKCSNKAIAEIFSNYKKTYSQVGLSSVVPEMTKMLVTLTKKEYGIKPLLIKKDITPILNFNYYKGTPGSDRIAIAIAARTMFPNKNILIFDFGTATTANLISGKIFKGGLIMPGFRTSLKSLISATALPEVNPSIPKKKELYFKSTRDNIFYGAYLQTLYSVQKLIELSKRKYKNLLVVVTGGNARYFLKHLDYDLCDNFLSLKGICIILEYYGTIQKK